MSNTRNRARERYDTMPRRERDEATASDPKLIRQCSGKIGYPSKRAARGIVRVMNQDGRHRPGGVLEPYKCRACGSWHVGNSYPARRRLES